MKLQIFLLSLFLCLFSFSSTTFASSSAGEVTKQLILSKSQLEKQGKTGKNYIKAIDIFVEKNALDSGKLSEIQQKITTVLPKLGNSQKDRVIKEVLNYLDYKIQYVSLKAPTMSSGSSGSSSGGVTQTSSQNQNAEEMKKMILGMSEEELVKYLEKLSIEELKNIVNTLITKDEQAHILSLYTSQIKKARDSIRYSDLRMLQSAIEQNYQDIYDYPSYEEFRKKVSIYANIIPKDPLHGFSYNNCNFGYTYEIGTNPGELKNKRYKLSTCVEDDLIKAQSDGGNDSKKLEIGNFDAKTIFSEVYYIDTVQTWKEYTDNSTESSGSSPISRDLYISMIGFYWLSQNPETIEKINADTRNLKRITSILGIQSVIEKYYQNNFKYPKIDEISKLSQEIEKDEFAGKNINGCIFGYYYEVGDSINIKGDVIERQKYRISTCRENESKYIRSTYGDETFPFTQKILIQ